MAEGLPKILEQKNLSSKTIIYFPPSLPITITIHLSPGSAWETSIYHQTHTSLTWTRLGNIYLSPDPYISHLDPPGKHLSITRPIHLSPGPAWETSIYHQTHTSLTWTRLRNIYLSPDPYISHLSPPGKHLSITRPIRLSPGPAWETSIYHQTHTSLTWARLGNIYLSPDQYVSHLGPPGKHLSITRPIRLSPGPAWETSIYHQTHTSLTWARLGNIYLPPDQYVSYLGPPGKHLSITRPIRLSPGPAWETSKGRCFSLLTFNGMRPFSSRYGLQPPDTRTLTGSTIRGWYGLPVMEPKKNHHTLLSLFLFLFYDT